MSKSTPRRFQWTTPGCVFFRLYATRAIYFNVFIHKTRKLMFKANPGMKRNYLACCRGLDVTRYRNGKARKLGLLANLHFFRGATGTEIVSHELLHATLNFARRMKLDPMAPGGNMSATRLRESLVDPDEEKVCLVHGRLMRQFVDIAYKKGVYQE